MLFSEAVYLRQRQVADSHTQDDVIRGTCSDGTRTVTAVSTCLRTPTYLSGKPKLRNHFGLAVGYSSLLVLTA